MSPCTARTTPSCFARTVGAVMTTLSASAFTAYLVFLEDARGAAKFHFNLEGCDHNVFVESLVDSCLEYSLISREAICSLKIPRFFEILN